MVDWNEPVDKALSQTSYWKTFDQFRLESLNRVQVNPVDLKVIPGDTESRSSGFTSQMLSISQFENTTVVWMYIHRKRLRFYQLVKSHCATDVFSGFHAKKCFPQPANDVCNMICNRRLDIFGWDSLPRIFYNIWTKQIYLQYFDLVKTAWHLACSICFFYLWINFSTPYLYMKVLLMDTTVSLQILSHERQIYNLMALLTFRNSHHLGVY